MLAIYWVYLKITVALQFQYRVAMAIWMINRIVEPTVFLVVWVTVAAARGTVGGYGAADFAAYFIVLMVVNQLTFTWIIYEFEYRIRSGELSAMLLKPIHPFHSDVADNIGYKILTLTIIVPVVILLTVLFDPAFGFQAASLALGAVALAAAYWMRMVLDWTFALSAFWTTRSTALAQIYFLVMLFFSGRLAPMELMPAWLERMSWYLPFRWIIWFPVELLLNRLDRAMIVAGFQMQVLWLVVALVLLQVAWRLGVRKFTAVGN